MKDANKKDANKVIILAEREMQNNNILLKDMSTGEQKEINIDEFTSSLD